MILSIDQFVNNRFTSNTFSISSVNNDFLVFIDFGTLIDVVKNFGEAVNKTVFLFLTHCHYDHIYFVNNLIEAVNRLEIYSSQHTLSGLSNPKQNLSFYHEDPVSISVRFNNTFALIDGSCIQIDNQCEIIAYHTPGHNPGCMSYQVANHLFTGDSYIPFRDIVTKLRGGNKKQAAESLERIRDLIQLGMYIHPGHGPSYRVDDSILEDIDKQIERLISL
jgi:glyoxylase-like metal-dependent hydrolase (beta-lactamase superfamily II)